MAWEGSTRRARLPSDWQGLRLRVLRRDRYRCQHRDASGRKCNAPANQVDHIERGDDHRIANLQSLCAPHHTAKSSREGVEARQERYSRRADPEPHPGDVRN